MSGTLTGRTDGLGGRRDRRRLGATARWVDRGVLCDVGTEARAALEVEAARLAEWMGPVGLL